MNFKSLSDELLHEKTVLAASEEKQATLRLLEFLAEADERRLYSARGFSSLWEYVHIALGYSESQASERVSAMRLMRKVPEVREMLSENKLTLTSTAKLASFVRRENCSAEKTNELLEKIAEKPVREVERVLSAEQTVPTPKPDVFKPQGLENTRVSFDADPEFLALYEELKNSQGRPDWEMNERLKDAMKTVLKKKKRDLAPESQAERSPPVLRAQKVTPQQNEGSARRYFSAFVKTSVRKRSGNRCEYIDKATQRRCTSRFGLEFDHLVPYAKGGGSTFENCRHLCANHNRFEAVREFGQEKMSPYFRAG
jgi:5-methylcytosine-specific restriction endonuclease McrA